MKSRYLMTPGCHSQRWQMFVAVVVDDRLKKREIKGGAKTRSQKVVVVGSCLVPWLARTRRDCTRLP